MLDRLMSLVLVATLLSGSRKAVDTLDHLEQDMVATANSPNHISSRIISNLPHTALIKEVHKSGYLLVMERHLVLEDIKLLNQAILHMALHPYPQG